MKRRILASLMVLGLLYNGIAVQAAAAREACDHTNIHSFDTTTSISYSYHDSNGTTCRITKREYFTTYVCSDCGTIVDTIDHTSTDHSVPGCH